jgi:phosphate starvation-inducible PhoH-like protein
VHLQGSDEQVRRALAVINELRKIIQRQGHLMEAEVENVVERHSYDELRPDEATIELFEKARKITPRTSGQAAYVQAMRENELVFCMGPAGCGKTYLAVAMAVHALRQEMVKKIVLVRPAVEAGEKLGFLPGDMLAKVNPFLRPLLDALHEMLDFEQVTRYMEKDVIEIVPLAFMRGRTLNNTFMILDEGQNTTVTQMKMFLTRMGIGSRIVVTGDVTQIDLPPHVASGLTDAIERLSKINGVATSRLTGRDIVRHRLVKEIVKAYEPTEHPHPASGSAKHSNGAP